MATAKSKKGVRSENVNALFKNISKQKTKISKNNYDDLTDTTEDSDVSNSSQNETFVESAVDSLKKNDPQKVKTKNDNNSPEKDLDHKNNPVVAEKILNKEPVKPLPESTSKTSLPENEKGNDVNIIMENNAKSSNEIESFKINSKMTLSEGINSIESPSKQEESNYIEVITAKAGRPKKFTNGTFSISIRLPAELEPIFDIAIQRFQGNKTAYLTQLVVKDLMENQENYKMMDEAVKQLEALRNSMFGNDKNLMNSINKAAIDWSGLKL